MQKPQEKNLHLLIISIIICMTQLSCATRNYGAFNEYSNETTSRKQLEDEIAKLMAENNREKFKEKFLNAPLSKLISLVKERLIEFEDTEHLTWNEHHYDFIKNQLQEFQIEAQQDPSSLYKECKKQRSTLLSVLEPDEFRKQVNLAERQKYAFNYFKSYNDWKKCSDSLFMNKKGAGESLSFLTSWVTYNLLPLYTLKLDDIRNDSSEVIKWVQNVIDSPSFKTAEIEVSVLKASCILSKLSQAVFLKHPETSEFKDALKTFGNKRTIIMASSNNSKSCTTNNLASLKENIWPVLVWKPLSREHLMFPAAFPVAFIELTSRHISEFDSVPGLIDNFVSHDLGHAIASYNFLHQIFITAKNNVERQQRVESIRFFQRVALSMQADHRNIVIQVLFNATHEFALVSQAQKLMKNPSTGFQNDPLANYLHSYLRAALETSKELQVAEVPVEKKSYKNVFYGIDHKATQTEMKLAETAIFKFLENLEESMTQEAKP